MAAATISAQLVRTTRPERVLRECKDTETDVNLSRGRLWLAGGNNCWRAITCLEGVIWITQDWDLQDYIIKAGEMFIISQPGKVIVQALTNARMQIKPPQATVPFCGRFEDTIFQ